MSGASAGEPGFSARLIAWQELQGRHDLPWQPQRGKPRDAYRIWLSEIMLQQTQVSTVIPYYARFLERFPDIEALASAPIESVLELWAGLGYYARARNLHRCAQIVVGEHGGRFPRLATEIADLPGIGRSTAAAISAFAFGQRAAILDGNVKRVLARCFAIEGFPGAAKTGKELWTLAESLLPITQIEAYTQGLMDLGATLCTRGKPFCSACPMHDLCLARQGGRQAELPAGKPRKRSPNARPACCCSPTAAACCSNAARRAASGVACWHCRKLNRGCRKFCPPAWLPRTRYAGTGAAQTQLHALPADY